MAEPDPNDDRALAEQPVDQREDSDWTLVDAPPFYRLVADVIDEIIDWLPWSDRVHFRLTCRKVAVQNAAMWAAVSAAVREARRRGLTLKTHEVALGLGITLLGVAATGATVIGMGGAAYFIGGKLGGDVAVLLGSTFATRAVRLTAGGVDKVYRGAKRQAVGAREVTTIVESEQAWRPADDFDIPDRDDVAAAQLDATEVLVLTERQRFSVLTQQWRRDALLPIDPPAWECPQLGLPGPGNPIAHIQSPDDVTLHAAHGPGDLDWEWAGPWSIIMRDRPIISDETHNDHAPGSGDDAAPAAAATGDDRDESDVLLANRGDRRDHPEDAPAAAANEQQQGQPWWMPSALSSCLFRSESSHPDDGATDDATPRDDPDGWHYGLTFMRGGASRSHNTPLDVVRERRWRRVLRLGGSLP